MGVASLVISILALIVSGIALIPFLNLLNCISMPLAFLGGIFGLVDVVSYKPPYQSKAPGILGLIFSILAFLIAIVRFIISLIVGLPFLLPGVI
jgi:hypothetical protein